MKKVSDAILRCVFFCSVVKHGDFYAFNHAPPLDGTRPPEYRTYAAAFRRGLIRFRAPACAGDATDEGRMLVVERGWLLYAGAEAC